MAPKKPFKVHSLSKHIEDTKKGLSAEAQYNKRPVSKSTVSIKREPGTIDKAIFGNNSDNDDSDSSSSGSSDEDGSDFLRKLQGTKTATATTPKKPARRDEIADSDNERQPTAKNVAPVKSNQSESSSSDDSSNESQSDSDSESGAKLKSTNSEQKVRANGAPVKTVVPSSSGSTSSSDSEEEGNESSSDDERAKNATATKGKDSTSPDEESSDSASDEGSDDESEPAASTQHKPATKPANGTSTATTTSGTSSSDEDEGTTDDEKDTAAKSDSMAMAKSVSNKSSDDSSQDSSEEDADVSMHIADRQHGRQTTVPDFIAPDFVLRKSNDGTNGQDVARICSQANLQGKQVWYFTVPANVPISVVQNMEIPMNQSHRGDSIFSHNGEDYGISMDTMTPKSSIQILIPSSDGARYQSAPRPIDQVMQVKKITQLGQGSVTTPSPAGPTPKPPPRQQPEGLKARYQPFGVNSPMGQIGVDLSFRVENDPATADASVLSIPSSSTQSKSDKKEKKRKHKEAEKGESETPRKGKRKHVSSDDDAVAAAEQLREENLCAETKSKKQKTGRDGSPDLGSDAPPSSAVSKKQKTLVVPGAIPASTPSKSKSKPKSKSSKSKPETPASKPRETAVPVPQVPGSSQPKISPVPVPQPGLTWTPPAGRDDKKSKKRKAKTPDATAKTQQSPPPSAQPAGKTSKHKVTPVPMPKFKHTG